MNINDFNFQIVFKSNLGTKFICYIFDGGLRAVVEMIKEIMINNSTPKINTIVIGTKSPLNSLYCALNDKDFDYVYDRIKIKKTEHLFIYNHVTQKDKNHE